MRIQVEKRARIVEMFLAFNFRGQPFLTFSVAYVNIRQPTGDKFRDHKILEECFTASHRNSQRVISAKRGCSVVRPGFDEFRGLEHPRERVDDSKSKRAGIKSQEPTMLRPRKRLVERFETRQLIQVLAAATPEGSESGISFDHLWMPERLDVAQLPWEQG